MSMANPYPLLQQKLRAAFSQQPPHQSRLQIAFLSGLLAVQLGLVLTVIALRVHRTGLAGFWIFRVVRTDQGALLSPHAVNSFLLLSAMFLVLVQPYVFRQNLMLSTLIWIPLILSRWTISWSTTLGCITTAGTRSMGSKQGHESSFVAMLSRPRFLNGAFVLAPIFMVVILIPLAAQASSSNDAGVVKVVELDGALSAASVAFPNVSNATNAAMHTLFLEMMAEMAKSGAALNDVWCAWATFGAIDFVLFFVSSCCYYKNLWRSLQELKVTNARSPQLDELRSATRGLLWTSIVSFLLAGSHFAVSVYLATGQTDTELATLIVLWTSAILGGATSVILFLRCFNSFASPSPRTAEVPASDSRNRDTVLTLYISTDSSATALETKFEVDERDLPDLPSKCEHVVTF